MSDDRSGRPHADEAARTAALDALGRIEERLATLITLQRTTNQLLQDLLDRPRSGGAP